MSRFCLFLTLFLCSNIIFSQQKKEDDFDINYNESKVPSYQLPELQETTDGQKVETVKAWENQRRPEILALFSNLVYGIIPVPNDPIQVGYTTIKENSNFLNGKGTRKDIIIKLKNSKGEVEMKVLLVVPNEYEKPVSAFMMISFDASDSEKLQLSNRNNGRFNNGWPIEQLLDSGYAFVSVYHQDLVKHNDVDFNSGIHPLFYMENQSFPKSNEWGVLAACGYGASIALDYLETVENVDHEKIAVMGHSKLGKAALWVAARDQRFAMAISANSGCAGAALWRRKYGETLQKMCTRFPYWLCYNAQKFIGREEDLPVDQHMLLALMAPRPVYVASAEKDNWADPKGEFLSAYHASPIYQLYGKKGMESIENPEKNKAYLHQDVGFHLRDGGHYIADYDWHRFIDFANYHFK